MSDKKIVPFADLLSDDAIRVIGREWIARCADGNSDPIAYIHDVVRDLVAINLEFKRASVSLSVEDWQTLFPVEPAPSPEPGTPTQTAPEDQRETR